MVVNKAGIVQIPFTDIQRMLKLPGHHLARVVQWLPEDCLHLLIEGPDMPEENEFGQIVHLRGRLDEDGLKLEKIERPADNAQGAHTKERSTFSEPSTDGEFAD